MTVLSSSTPKYTQSEEQNTDTSLDLSIQNVCHLKLLSNAHLNSITLEAEAGGSPVGGQVGLQGAQEMKQKKNFQLK